jgi:hypothetical protein
MMNHSKHGQYIRGFVSWGRIGKLCARTRRTGQTVVDGGSGLGGFAYSDIGGRWCVGGV